MPLLMSVRGAIRIAAAGDEVPSAASKRGVPPPGPALGIPVPSVESLGPRGQKAVVRCGRWEPATILGLAPLLDLIGRRFPEGRNRATDDRILEDLRRGGINTSLCEGKLPPGTSRYKWSWHCCLLRCLRCLYRCHLGLLYRAGLWQRCLDQRILHRCCRLCKPEPHL